MRCIVHHTDGKNGIFVSLPLLYFRHDVRKTFILITLRYPYYRVSLLNTPIGPIISPLLSLALFHMLASQDVIHFWFNEITPKDWWKKSDKLDAQIAERFGEVHAAAIACELYTWRATAEGRLAEIIVLDQFSRNIYRDQPKSFSSDSLALSLAQEAIAQDKDKDVLAYQRVFMYMPYMHSESKEIHEQATPIFAQKGLEYFAGFEEKHKAIIETYGRYPHRNEILGRESTPEEIEFLKEPNSSF